MLKPESIVTVNTRLDGELCRNGCGFYGSKIWNGFCSKCYREVYQQAKQIQEAYDREVNTSIPNSLPSLFSNFHEKRRSNINIRNPIRQIVYRTGNLRSSNHSIISSLTNEEQTLEDERTNKTLDIVTTDNACIDIQSQVKTFAINFHKKCSNKNIFINTLTQDYGLFKDKIKKRIQTNSKYRNENEDITHRVRDYIESIIFSKDYSLIFDRIAIEYEEKDLAIQNRISSLHWITPIMLDVTLNEDISNVRETLYKAMNVLIELDTKTTPQGKIHSIMECKRFIEQSLHASSEKIINADCFLPALIYVVLKAKPPRLHSNIQFLSDFSQPSGEELYYLASLDSAVRFIELLQADHLGLSTNDFSSYMRGEPVLSSKFVSLYGYPFENESYIQQLRTTVTKKDKIEHDCEKLLEYIQDLNQRLSQSVTNINELLQDSYKRFSYLEEIPQSTKLKTNDKQIIDTPDSLTTENETFLTITCTAESEQ